MKNRESSGLLFQKARDYAFLLLKFRLRSEEEIYARLKRKKIPEETIRQTLTFLKEKGFVDDKLFAKNWLAFRIKRNLGLKRIKEELRIKGIKKEIIEEEVGAVKGHYCEADIVREVARQRLSRLKGLEPIAAKRRLYAYLLRRGFSQEIVAEAIQSQGRVF